MFVSQSARGTSDAKAIAERLGLFGLDGSDVRTKSRALQQQVIRPNIDEIVDGFCDLLVQIEDFNDVVARHSNLDRLRRTQRQYLLGLGVGFQRREYFEERMRIGSVHQQLGVSQSLYQCTYQQLQDLLIKHIPQHIRDDGAAFADMLRFILKITALDMSLAVESYCAASLSGLKKSLSDERGETQRLRQLSITDWLTELYNHSHSRRCLSAALDNARQEGAPLCVIMADLDHFKQINDTHGHLVGDEVLRIAAARMLSGARADDQIGRYGGEEFIFILRSSDIVEAEEVAERVRTRIRSDVVHSGDATIKITLSLGLAEARDDDSVDSLIERADSALYDAKRAGRDCVRIEKPGELPI